MPPGEVVVRSPVKKPMLTCDFEYSIKYLKSGLDFCFGAFDAFLEFYQEQISLRNFSMNAIVLTQMHGRILISKPYMNKLFGRPRTRNYLVHHTLNSLTQTPHQTG